MKSSCGTVGVNMRCQTSVTGLAQGVDCVTILGAGSLVICLGYLLMAPAAPFVVAPSLEQIAVGRSHK